MPFVLIMKQDTDSMSTLFKPFLVSLFSACLRYASTCGYSEARKDHALETLTILSRGCLSKGLSGWEVMELVAGSVAQSDQVFNVCSRSYPDSQTVWTDDGDRSSLQC
jgi:hypothetical protein